LAERVNKEVRRGRVKRDRRKRIGKYFFCGGTGWILFMEKGIDKGGKGASKFSGNDEDAGRMESQEEEPRLSVCLNYYLNYLNHYDYYFI